MKFSVSLTIGKEAQYRSSLIYDLFHNIDEFLKTRFYGDSICKYSIIIYVVNPPSGYEHLFKDFKPKYVEYKLLTNKLTGEPLEIIKKFNYSIRIDGELYDKFSNSTDNECKRILIKEILNSFSNLDKLPKKVKDFDKKKFVSDVENFCSSLI